MRIIEAIGIAVFIVLCSLGVLFLRREVIARGRSVELNIRLSSRMEGRGWSPGIARFAGDDLRWYRVFSLSVRPRRTLSRRALSVDGRRQPTATERLVLPAGGIIPPRTRQRGTDEVATAEAPPARLPSSIEAP